MSSSDDDDDDYINRLFGGPESAASKEARRQQEFRDSERKEFSDLLPLWLRNLKRRVNRLKDKCNAQLVDVNRGYLVQARESAEGIELTTGGMLAYRVVVRQHGQEVQYGFLKAKDDERDPWEDVDSLSLTVKDGEIVGNPSGGVDYQGDAIRHVVAPFFAEFKRRRSL